MEGQICPYCGKKLEVWEPHPETGWSDYLLVCGNDECEYFHRAREKVAEECKVNFAYRYCLNPKTGKAIPIVTWCGGDLSLLKGRAKKGP